jgi:hypothetical protein
MMKPIFPQQSAAPEQTGQPGSSYMLDQASAWKQIDPRQRARMAQRMQQPMAGQQPQNLPGQMTKPTMPQMQAPRFPRYRPNKPMFQGDQQQDPIVNALMGS